MNENYKENGKKKGLMQYQPVTFSGNFKIVDKTSKITFTGGLQTFANCYLVEQHRPVCGHKTLTPTFNDGFKIAPEKA